MPGKSEHVGSRSDVSRNTRTRNSAPRRIRPSTAPPPNRSKATLSSWFQRMKQNRDAALDKVNSLLKNKMDGVPTNKVCVQNRSGCLVITQSWTTEDDEFEYEKTRFNAGTPSAAEVNKYKTVDRAHVKTNVHKSTVIEYDHLLYFFMFRITKLAEQRKLFIHFLLQELHSVSIASFDIRRTIQQADEPITALFHVESKGIHSSNHHNSQKRKIYFSAAHSIKATVVTGPVEQLVTMAISKETGMVYVKTMSTYSTTECLLLFNATSTATMHIVPHPTEKTESLNVRTFSIDLGINYLQKIENTFAVLPSTMEFNSEQHDLTLFFLQKKIPAKRQIDVSERNDGEYNYTEATGHLHQLVYDSARLHALEWMLAGMADMMHVISQSVESKYETMSKILQKLDSSSKINPACIAQKDLLDTVSKYIKDTLKINASSHQMLLIRISILGKYITELYTKCIGKLTAVLIGKGTAVPAIEQMQINQKRLIFIPDETIDEFDAKLEFGHLLAVFLFREMDLVVIPKTKAGLPRTAGFPQRSKTGGKTIEAEVCNVTSEIASKSSTGYEWETNILFEIRKPIFITPSKFLSASDPKKTLNWWKREYDYYMYNANHSVRLPEEDSKYSVSICFDQRCKLACKIETPYKDLRGREVKRSNNSLPAQTEPRVGVV